MNFDDAISAHREWKRLLSDYVRRPDGSLRAADVAADHRCALGQWIEGKGRAYEELTEHSSLRAAHAEFHRLAAQIVRRVDAGEHVDPATEMDGNSRYARASQAIVAAILAMKEKAVACG